MSDLERAKERLSAGGYTCVMCLGDTEYTTSERGIRPLADMIESGMRLAGFSAADKVVGKGAAFLYVLLGVKAVYAGVISASAREVLENSGIEVSFGSQTENIINRRGDGICPFEEAVLDIREANEAYAVIKNKLEGMK